jgi:uncharacterized protein (DUF433 family)
MKPPSRVTIHEGQEAGSAEAIGLRRYIFRTKSTPGATLMTLKWQDYIEERKDVMVGKPVFKGTRLTVEFVLKQIGAGMTNEALLDQYPTLKPEHLRAAMLYAADVVSMDQSIYQ